MMTTTLAIKNAIYDVLVEDGGAREGDRTAFVSHWPECNEWRFGGKLGFGGKIWAPMPGFSTPHPYISYYRENDTPELHDLSIAMNIKLAEIW